MIIGSSSACSLGFPETVHSACGGGRRTTCSSRPHTRSLNRNRWSRRVCVCVWARKRGERGADPPLRRCGAVSATGARYVRLRRRGRRARAGRAAVRWRRAVWSHSISGLVVIDIRFECGLVVMASEADRDRYSHGRNGAEEGEGEGATERNDDDERKCNRGCDDLRRATGWVSFGRGYQRCTRQYATHSWNRMEWSVGGTYPMRMRAANRTAVGKIEHDSVEELVGKGLFQAGRVHTMANHSTALQHEVDVCPCLRVFGGQLLGRVIAR